MSDETYNGWTNYETWNVALWLNNDQGLQEAAHEIVSESWDDTYPWKAGEALKDFVEEMQPDLGANMWSDLLTAALSQVHWTEIAENFHEDED